MYITIVVKQVYWYISQVSGERLQDHWSSGLYLYRPVCVGPVGKPHCWFSHEAAHIILSVITEVGVYCMVVIK